MGRAETLEKLFPTVMKIKNKGHKEEQNEDGIDLIAMPEENHDNIETDEYGDAVTEVLTSTSKEFLENDITKFSKTQVKNMFAEDREREMCRLGNMRTVVLDGISSKGTSPALRGKYVEKLKIIDQNMNLLAEVISKAQK